MQLLEKLQKREALTYNTCLKTKFIPIKEGGHFLKETEKCK